MNFLMSCMSHIDELNYAWYQQDSHATRMSGTGVMDSRTGDVMMMSDQLELSWDYTSEVHDIDNLKSTCID